MGGSSAGASFGDHSAVVAIASVQSSPAVTATRALGPESVLGIPQPSAPNDGALRTGRKGRAIATVPRLAAPIEIHDLTKRFGRFRSTLAVEGLSFHVGDGRIVGFLGPNGAGKSTTLRALLGLIEPSSGHTLIEGSPFLECGDPARTVGAVLEVGAAHPGRSGRNHLRALALAAGVPRGRV